MRDFLWALFWDKIGEDKFDTSPLSSRLKQFIVRYKDGAISY
jgi:hypothetical protein